MNRFVYSTLLYLATPLLILRLFWRSLRSPAYLEHWSERFAFYGRNARIRKADVIFHAVSVGEVHAAVPLIDRLLEENPSLDILVTTLTPTGSSRVTEILGDRVYHGYLPYDFPGAVRRFLDLVDPRLLVIMETELWPNLIHCCAHKGIKVMLANARLSEKSFGEYLKIRKLAGQMLAGMERVTAQSPLDSERLQSLGLPADKVEVAGSMKYDMAIDDALGEQAGRDRESMGGRPVFIAASTRSVHGNTEDEKVLAAFSEILESHPDLLLVLVPRHPERFDSVYELATGKGFQVARRSREGTASATHAVLLGDSLGEMQYFYGLADIAFVGGSLVPTGCQNIIEPAMLGLPVVTGPSLYNFQAVSEQLREAGAQTVVEDENKLVVAVNELLDDENKRIAMGNAARMTVQANQGATQRNLALISGMLKDPLK